MNRDTGSLDGTHLRSTPSHQASRTSEPAKRGSSLVVVGSTGSGVLKTCQQSMGYVRLSMSALPLRATARHWRVCVRPANEHVWREAGIFAFAGVLIGGLSTAVSAWFFQRRKRSAPCSSQLAFSARTLSKIDLPRTLLSRGWFKGLGFEIGSWPDIAPAGSRASKDAWDEIANAMAGVARIQIMITELLKLMGDELSRTRYQRTVGMPRFRS